MLQLKLQKHQRYMCVLSPSYVTQCGDLIFWLCERLDGELLCIYSSKNHLFHLRKWALTSIEICTRRRPGTQMNRKNNQKVVKWGIIINYLCSAQDIWHLIFYPAFYISSYCTSAACLRQLKGGGVPIKDCMRLQKIIKKETPSLLPSYLMLYISHAVVNPNHIL